MRSDHIAEWILSLVEAPDRAATAAGDLMEEAGERGRLWFWISVSRTALALLGRGLTAAPIRMMAFAGLAWFAYMTVSLILGFGSYILLTLLWGAGYFLTHHTGLELLSGLMRLRFDWPPAPPETMRWIELVMLGIAAPLQVGRFTARCWAGGAIAAWIYLAMAWPLMTVLVPFVAAATRVSLPMLPVIEVFVLLGAVVESRRPRRFAEPETR